MILFGNSNISPHILATIPLLYGFPAALSERTGARIASQPPHPAEADRHGVLLPPAPPPKSPAAPHHFRPDCLPSASPKVDVLLSTTLPDRLPAQPSAPSLRCRPLLPCRCAARRIHTSHRERVAHPQPAPATLLPIRVRTGGTALPAPIPIQPIPPNKCRATMPPYHRNTEASRPMHALATRRPSTHSLASFPISSPAILLPPR